MLYIMGTAALNTLQHPTQQIEVGIDCFMRPGFVFDFHGQVVDEPPAVICWGVAATPVPCLGLLVGVEVHRVQGPT